jgi:phosphomethylpyrimidine synthase
MNPIVIGNTRRGVKLSGGTGCPVRLVASIGLSPHQTDPAGEVAKAHAAVAAGADIINDDSIVEPAGTALLERLLNEFQVPVNTEPIFDTVASAAVTGDFLSFSVRDVVSTVEKHCRMGIDILTIHFAYSKRLAEMAAGSRRAIRTTSRGGALLTAYMARSGEENPYRVARDQVFDVLAAERVTLSLGTVLRPGSVTDGLDNLFTSELNAQAEFVDAALSRGIPVMVEGPGHVPATDVSRCVESMKAVANHIPVRLLGPTVCDCATGHDHIVGVVGAVFAILAGCEFLTCTPRSEHLGLPTVADVAEAVKAYRTVAYAVQQGPTEQFRRDLALSQARAKCDWEGMWSHSLFPEDGARLHSMLNAKTDGACTVCGRYCPLILADVSLLRIAKGAAVEHVRTEKDGHSDGK